MLWLPTSQTPEEVSAEFYDLFYGDRKDVDFFVSVAQQIGGPVLELGCGTGRILVPIAAAGVDIAGIDLSPANLDICRTRLEAVIPRAAASRVIEADMRRFELDRTFRLAIFPFRTLQEILTVDDKVECLRCTRRHLQDGGFVLIDNYNPSIPYLAEPLGAESSSPLITLADGRRVRRTDRVVGRDLFAQTQECEIVYDVTQPGGTRERTVISYRTSYMFRYELEHLLARTGFDVVEVYGAYDRSPFGTAYPGELIMLGRVR
ncbi:MAG TPA: class I SAM-dependent methyltransferase [Thermoanaerobaculia bacterium]|nr:class I SAM-dependent methyltransferase [Thermoanaerobaculia bacterium]